jgi:molybdate/tungstate transport system substrate-binding protein
MKVRLFVVLAAALAVAAGLAAYRSLTRRPPVPELRVFHAAGLTPVFDQIRDRCERDRGLRILNECSGSQVACRKVSELGRACDLLCLADNGLVGELLKKECRWRIDFATDRVVIGVGKLAPDVSKAEKDWPAVLLQKDVRIARVDENQGPIGYCTLLVWKLQEQRATAGLTDRLAGKCASVVDDVSKLPPLLKSGQIDYAFLYRSTCMANGIRSIELAPEIDLGDPQRDYSAASVMFQKLSAGTGQRITVRGKPVVWTLTVPERGAQTEEAHRFIRYFLTDAGSVLAGNGFVPLAPPVFFGTKEDYRPFEAYVRYGGALTP